MEYSQRIREYFKPVIAQQTLQELREVEFPLLDEFFCVTWSNYELEARGNGLYQVLRQHLVQLQFPVREGISKEEVYKKVTRQGYSAEGTEKIGIQLQSPQKLRLDLYPTLAGQLPVLFTGCRGDFEFLVQALSARNEPVLLPSSMGASLVKGYNNWDRVNEMRRRQYVLGLSADLNQNLNTNRKYYSCAEGYQDCFMILSAGDYSGVPAVQLGLAEAEWRRLSLIIRREHEATHYFTQRVLGFMRNHLVDELMADFMGIVAARGEYDPYWQLVFLGLEDYPRYRKGARLENYVQDAGFTEEEVEVLRELVVRAVGRLEDFYRKRRWSLSLESGKAELLLELLAVVTKELFIGNPL
ncbi:MAG: hypothetical protein WCR27_03235 [Eubacteriales bacterium]